MQTPPEPRRRARRSSPRRWPLRARSSARWPRRARRPACPAAATRPPAPPSTDPAALVHPLDGTGTGPVSPGTVGEFPGADTPFGMIQWSPDTSPNAVQSGGGYDDADSQDQRVQPDPPERHGLPLLSGRPHPAHRRRDRYADPADHHGDASPTSTSGHARPLSGRARSPAPSVSRSPSRRAPGSPASTSPRHRSQCPLQGGRQRQSRSRPPTCTSSGTTRWRVRSPAASSARPGPTTRCPSSRSSTGPFTAAGTWTSAGAAAGRVVRRDVVRRLRHLRHRRRSARSS